MNNKIRLLLYVFVLLLSISMFACKVNDEKPNDNNDNQGDIVIPEKEKKIVRFIIDGEIKLERETDKDDNSIEFDDFDKSKMTSFNWVITNEKDANGKDIEIHTLEYELIQYNVKLYDGNTLLSDELVVVDTHVTLSPIEKEGYVFVGWFLDSLSLYPIESFDADHNYTLFARFTETVKHNPLALPTPTASITRITDVTLSNGTIAYQPILPAKSPSSNRGDYNWTSSDTSVATISSYSTMFIVSTGYTIITGTLKSDSSKFINCIVSTEGGTIKVVSEQDVNTVKTYNITFVGKNNEVIKRVVTNGTTDVIYPMPPHYDGYTFIGWDKDNYGFTRDVTIKAKYVENGGKEYLGETFAIIGDSISTFSNMIPSGYACFYPYASDLSDYNQTWWMQVINKLGGYLFFNESYSGSCVNAGAASDSVQFSRLNHLNISGVTPDNILIYMGSNDCASQYVSLEQFDSGYKLMIERLQSICPESKIYLMTLAQNKLYTDENRVLYNEVILKYANEFNLDVIDLSNTNLKPYLVDSAHPSKDGMVIFANAVIEELRK